MSTSNATGTVLPFGKACVLPDMTVLEFLAGMALARKGPSSLARAAGDVALWFDSSIEPEQLMPPLIALVGRGWADSERSLFQVTPAGCDALRGFFVAMVRMLDAGRGLLDVAVLTSIVREFEGRKP